MVLRYDNLQPNDVHLVSHETLSNSPTVQVWPLSPTGLHQRTHLDTLSDGTRRPFVEFVQCPEFLSYLQNNW